MAFVNEYIPEEDYDKYDLRRVCGEHNLPFRRGHMFANAWTIDRERDAFLIQVWSHRDAEFDGWAFYWKGTWMFFEMKNVQFKKHINPSDPQSPCWIRYGVKGFSIPAQLESVRPQVADDFHQALVKYCGGGVYSDCTDCTATIDFIGE